MARRAGTAEGDDALLGPFAEHAQRRALEVDVIAVQTGQLRNADRGAVERFEHRVIAQVQRGRPPPRARRVRRAFRAHLPRWPRAEACGRAWARQAAGSGRASPGPPRWPTRRIPGQPQCAGRVSNAHLRAGSRATATRAAPPDRRRPAEPRGRSRTDRSDPPGTRGPSRAIAAARERAAPCTRRPLGRGPSPQHARTARARLGGARAFTPRARRCARGATPPHRA